MTNQEYETKQMKHEYSIHRIARNNLTTNQKKKSCSSFYFHRFYSLIAAFECLRIFKNHQKNIQCVILQAFIKKNHPLSLKYFSFWAAFFCGSAIISST